jgi:hypothetical protein
MSAQETDELWVPDEREAREAVAARGAQFLSWLLSRPEREIAVVSHSGFLVSDPGTMHRCECTVLHVGVLCWASTCS